MKLADLDWGEVMAMLPRWEALSPEARMAFVTIRPGQAGDPLTLGPAAAELVAAGFLTPPGPKGRLYAYAPELRPLLVALRAMDRLRPLDGLGGALSDMYVQDQLNTEEAIAVVGRQNGPYHWVDRGAVAATVSSVDWLNGFMAAAPGTPLLEWEQSHLPRGQQPRIASPAVGDALRRLLRALAERPQGVPLREFAALLPDLPPRVAFAALAGGLRYLLLFTSLRNDDDPEAVVGLLPSILRRMGPPPPPPAPVAVTATFESPFRIADMTTVLVDAAAEPIPVRGGDGGLYVRAQKVLAARLVRPPRWAEALLFEIDEDDDELDAELAAAGAMEMRIALAVEALTLAGLAKIAKAGEKWQLAATAQGRAWLALAEGERLKRVLDLYRASKQRTPGGWSTPRGTVDFLGVRLPFAMDDAKPDLRGALSAALLALPAGEMIPLGAFMRHQAELQNPFLGLEGKYLHSRGGYYGNVPRTREGWESIWSQMIDVFLRMRLVPLGGARLGRMEDGKVAFAVTDTGRYLLGGTDEYRLTAQPDGEVVVQPDFEVVFLSAAPRIESELSRLAERTGAGHVGALFRITRASVLRAAESGMTADAMLKTLGQVSRAPVPANVARQVKDWFGGTRRVRIRPTVLVECPDTETAARVTALGGASVSAVTRTILRLDGDDKSVAALVKKLRAKGIFVQD